MESILAAFRSVFPGTAAAVKRVLSPGGAAASPGRRKRGRPRGSSGKKKRGEGLSVEEECEVAAALNFESPSRTNVQT